MAARIQNRSLAPSYGACSHTRALAQATGIFCPGKRSFVYYSSCYNYDSGKNALRLVGIAVIVYHSIGNEINYYHFVNII